MLKDQARRAQGKARGSLFLRSAKAYADAAALRPDSYPLINAATMSFFAGQPDQMALLAQQVLALLETGTGTSETPYWHDATKAEALLLLGQQAEAEAALRKARAHAPRAWEDHATTLRQFRAILAHRDEATDWLTEYAPPKSIYFKGMIGIADDDQHATDAIATLVANSGAGFVFGALAAGADILIAEAALHVGAELHVVLPVAPATFRARSVAPYGADWLARFDSLFEQAASVEIVDSGDRLSSAAIQLAAEVAKGRAIDNATRLESEALPLEVIDGESSDAAHAPDVLRLNRSAKLNSASGLEDRQTVVLIATNEAAALQNLNFDQHAGLATAVIGSAESGADTIRQLRAAIAEATIAVHAMIADDLVCSSAAVVQLDRLLQAAAPGTVIATSTAAMMLKAVEPELWIEPLGELPDPVGALAIYALGISI